MDCHVEDAEVELAEIEKRILYLGVVSMLQQVGEHSFARIRKEGVVYEGDRYRRTLDIQQNCFLIYHLDSESMAKSLAGTAVSAP